MHLRSKLISGICPKIGGEDGRTGKPSQIVHSAINLKKKNCICWKTKNTCRFYAVKISVPSVYVFMIKNASEICQKIVSLDLRTALKMPSKMCQ